MASRSIWAFLLLAGLARTTPAAGPPATAGEPEQLLPATTQVYVRWDGVQAHRDAYRRSALGQMLGGEMGRSIRAIWGRFGTNLKVWAVGDKLLEGLPPAELLRRDELVSAFLALPPVLGQTGVVAGFEARVVPPSSTMFRRLARLATGASGPEEFVLPQFQLTAIVPGAKQHPPVVKFLDKLSAFEAEGAIKKVAVAGRYCRVVKGGAGEWGWAWWLEGKHLVVVGALGDPVPGVVRVLQGGAGVTGHPLYKALAQPRAFEVTTRGFVDGKAITSNLRWLRFIQPMVVAALEDAGLLDVQAVRLWEGFEGDASRAAWEVDFNSPQRGISRFLIKKSINLKDLPPLPADAYRWTAARTNVAAVYDLILTAATAAGEDPPGPSLLGATKAFAEAKKRTRKELEDTLGVKMEDVLGSLGDTFLTHCSPGDGLSTLGQVVAISVKDERKLSRALDPLLRKVATLLGNRVRFRKRTFHGATIREIVAPGDSPISLACTIHKGWLVLALHQQPVQGFILRTGGKLEAWKPDRRTARALARVPAGAGLVQVVDPRATVKVLLSAAPAVVGLFPRDRGIRSMIDPGDVPHAGSVTSHLFPNVSWTTFDGKTFRIESRESLWLPLQEIGWEWLPFAGRF
jgi:hypothetical protein